MDTRQSDSASAMSKAMSNPRTGETRETKLDEQLRELYDAYGEGKMPEEVRKLAEALDRERVSLTRTKTSQNGQSD